MENIITTDQWKEGLLDVCSFLHSEMITFLKEENRYFGRVKSYTNNLRDAYYNFETGTTDEEMTIYGRVLSTIRSVIYREFKRLGQRRLSTADRVIVITRKMLEMIDSIPSGTFKYDREVRTLKKVIDKLFDNIYFKSKNDSLVLLCTTIQSSVSSGELNKFPYDVLDLYHIEHPLPKVLTLEKPETLLVSNGPSISESKEIQL